MIDSLSFEDLDRCRQDYDDAVSASVEIDRFCSSSYWVLPAARHLMPAARARIFREGDAFVVLAETSSWLHPLEATWGLPCPLVAREPERAVRLLGKVLSREASWSRLLLSGLRDGSELWRRVVPALARDYALAAGPQTRRYVADLKDGAEGFLRRRSPGFRKNLLKAERRARDAGLTFEVADDLGAGSFERLLEVERRSWKGLGGVGIESEPMRSFYADMSARLLAAGKRRLTFARLGGADVAYIFGGVFGDTYRGLQFSFDSRLAKLSLGNLCQFETIQRLAAEGIPRYDLGTEVRYKRRWGEVESTTALIVQRTS